MTTIQTKISAHGNSLKKETLAKSPLMQTTLDIDIKSTNPKCTL